MSTTALPKKVHDLAPDSPVARANRLVDGTPQASLADGLPLIAIVGNPNVGKSVVFHLLTGRYVVVSNYPGTTISLTKGQCELGGVKVRVCDTPGMYSLVPVTEEERIARRILLHDRPAAVVHVVDAKNLPRMLPFTLQLIEAGLPVVVALNLMDEAAGVGLSVDAAALQEQLGVPVIPMTAITGAGANQLRSTLSTYVGGAAAGGKR
ncbi:MAG TPA: FeoB small GTPase domain-containing protein [bacterium]|nr:FeoB small GTPase domain-containing protein [bacterium]